MASVIFWVCYTIVTILTLVLIDFIAKEIFEDCTINAETLGRAMRWAFVAGGCYLSIAEGIQKVVMGQ